MDWKVAFLLHPIRDDDDDVVVVTKEEEMEMKEDPTTR